MNKEINEAAGALGGLPKHWIKYLAERYGKGAGGVDMAGEKSIVTPIKRFDGGYVKKALKDENNIAVIGRYEGKPLFMIAKHDRTSSKFRIFEVTVGSGNYYAKGSTYYTGRRRRHSHTADAYNMNEIIDVIDKMFTDNDDPSKLTVEAISKDPERASKIKTRREQKSPTDPLDQGPKPSYGDPSPNAAQRKRSKDWANKKRPILDSKMDNEVKKMKDKINDVLDTSLEKVIADVKKGYSYGLSKEALGKAILAQVDLNPIIKLAQGYSTLGNDYNSNPVYKRAKSLKQSGLIP